MDDCTTKSHHNIATQDHSEGGGHIIVIVAVMNENTEFFKQGAARDEIMSQRESRLGILLSGGNSINCVDGKQRLRVGMWVAHSW